MFNQKDITLMKAHGLSVDKILTQIEQFEKGIPFVKIVAPANSGNGIMSLDQKDLNDYKELYDKTEVSVLKFVPASGAATRMFRLLHQFLVAFDPQKEELDSFLQKEPFQELRVFFNELEKLPFYNLTMALLVAKHPKFELGKLSEKKYWFVKFMLEDLGYSDLPKGLIPFHQYADKTFTAFEEHLREAQLYATKDGQAQLHFTIDKDHLDLFKKCLEAYVANHQPEETQLKVSFSFQGKYTDTIAVNLDNTPFRDEYGQLHFRPGGHGALIQNLNQMDADIIFIKNIDNVVTEDNMDLMVNYKKVLAGILINLQEKVFGLLKKLDTEGFSEELLSAADMLADEYFHQQRKFEDEDEIRNFFERPIRVCGMVINQGEPGGGPFWVQNKEGNFSLQIVESAEFDDQHPRTQKILDKVTHFNPVDLVCGVRNYKGEKYDLQEFVAPNQGFITHKSIDGKDIKALELPGLWNGAMAYWNTIFVEVPHKTFNPVKTVLDLLKPGHQPKLASKK